MSMLWKCLTRLTDPYKRNLKDHTALIALFNAAKDANKDKDLLKNFLEFCVNYAAAIITRIPDLNAAIISGYEQLINLQIIKVRTAANDATYNPWDSLLENFDDYFKVVSTLVAKSSIHLMDELLTLMKGKTQLSYKFDNIPTDWKPFEKLIAIRSAIKDLTEVSYGSSKFKDQAANALLKISEPFNEKMIDFFDAVYSKVRKASDSKKEAYNSEIKAARSVVKLQKVFCDKRHPREI